MKITRISVELMLIFECNCFPSTPKEYNNYIIYRAADKQNTIKYSPNIFNETIILDLPNTTNKTNGHGFVSYRYQKLMNNLILVKNVSYKHHDLINKLQNKGNIGYVELDTIYKTSAEQYGSTWGLARISNRERLQNQEFTYKYNEDAGSGVDLFVIDTGINTQHTDFGGRAVWGANFVENTPDYDENGHGTHVAGTAGGSRFGVSKKVQLVAVKVLDGSGSGMTSGIIKGIDWVISNRKGSKSVINMSLGGSYSKAINYAVEKAMESGIVVVVASGNDNKDACYYSPASAQNIISVGATTIDDTLASFSNYGKCVSILAPGKDIMSDWNTGNQAIKSISGTSMASPHVAGLAAYYMSTTNNNNIIKLVNNINMHDQIKDVLLRTATKGAIKDVGDETNNYLAFNSYNGL